jgi:hypothetical protein
METPETLNTKHVYILLNFPMIIYVFMPINRAMAMAIERQHDVKFLMANWKQIELLRMGEILVQELN